MPDNWVHNCFCLLFSCRLFCLLVVYLLFYECRCLALMKIWFFRILLILVITWITFDSVKNKFLLMSNINRYKFATIFSITTKTFCFNRSLPLKNWNWFLSLFSLVYLLQIRFWIWNLIYFQTPKFILIQTLSLLIFKINHSNLGI